jgi:6-pyruvoyltetrahydropterin/6-carboxytetrahydropterin synthase
MYQVATATEFRAFHIMPGAPGPEGQLHTHNYRLEVIVERAELDHRGMVCDIDVLNAALADAAAVVRDVNVEVIQPPEAKDEAVTVEVFARWAHDTMAPAVRADGGQMLTVRVWESPLAYGAYGAALS